MSPVEALRELDSLYKIYIRDTKKGFKLTRTVTLTKNQEKILKQLTKNLYHVVAGKNGLELGFIRKGGFLISEE